MTRKEKEEFELIIADIKKNENFKDIDREVHHGVSRYKHSYRVAKGVYKLSKSLNFKTYREATRAALLHDFYFNYQLEEMKEAKKFYEHAYFAKENASIFFDLNDMQKNMIESHMFPCGKTLPKYKESVCLTIVDKLVSLYELPRYKMSLKISLYLLFIINMINLQK